MQAQFPVATSNIGVGDRVIIVLKKENHLDRGAVRFIGAITGIEGTYYGVELDEAKGQHDGKTYFRTEANRGTFVALKNLRKIEKEDFDVKGFNDMLKKEQAAKQVEKKKEAAETKPKDVAPESPAKVPATEPKPEPKTEVKPEVKVEPPKPKESPPAPAKTPVKDEKPAETPKLVPKVEKPAEPAKPPVVAPKPVETPKPAPAPKETKSDKPQVDREEMDRKLREQETNFNELVAKRDKDITALKSKVKQLEEQVLREKEKASKPSLSEKLEKEFQMMEEKFSNMSIEYESLKSELENTRYQLDEAKIRIQELEFDKEEMMLQAELVAEDVEVMSESDVAEMRKNYGFLKMAFSKLEEKYAADKEKFEAKVADYEAKMKGSDGLNNEQVKKMLKDKDRTISELRQRLEDSSGANDYISTLTEQLINAKNALEVAEDNMKDAKHTIKLNDEIIEELEEMNGLLNAENDQANGEIMALKEKIVLLQEDKKHDEDVISKYREKIKLIQGEIDIIRSQNSESKDQDKINKIDQLIKNYTLCLQEKRGVVKKLIVSEFKDIKDARNLMKSAIVLRSIPNRYMHDLEYATIEKYLSLLDLIKKIDLIIGQLKSNYLVNPLVIEDSPELILHISGCVATLLDTRRVLEYLFDFGFAYEKLDDLKALVRSPMFGVLVSIEVLLDRLVTEIREDNFNSKFNLKLLVDNNAKLFETINEITDGLKTIRLRESIDTRYYTRLAEIQYLVATGVAENRKQLTEAVRANGPKISSVANAVALEDGWTRRQDALLRRKGQASTQEDSTLDQSKADEGEERLFWLDKIKPFSEAIQQLANKLVDTQDVAALLEEIQPAVNAYVLSNAKKPKKSEDDEEYPVRLFTETGPWTETVNHVKKRLERFDEVQRESQEKTEKIEELHKRIGESDLKLENSAKVKGTLENRIKDLEFKNQNIPLLEGERIRAVEQSKILTSDVEKLKKEIATLEEKVKLGGGAGSGLFSVVKKTVGEEKKGLPNINFRAMDVGVKTGGLRPGVRDADGKGESIAYKSVVSYERIIENLQSQVVVNDETDIFDPARMMKEMPYFYRLYTKEKKKNAFGGSMEKDGRQAMGKLSILSHQVKNKIINRKIVDITKCEEKEAVRRLKGFAEKLKKEERDIEEDKERAVAILDEFQSRWISSYSQLTTSSLIHSKLLATGAVEAGQERVVGSVRIERLAEEKLKQNEDIPRVLLRKCDLEIKKAVSLI
jgi:hypothetical protein